MLFGYLNLNAQTIITERFKDLECYRIILQNSNYDENYYDECLLMNEYKHHANQLFEQINNYKLNNKELYKTKKAIENEKIEAFEITNIIRETNKITDKANEDLKNGVKLFFGDALSQMKKNNPQIAEEYKLRKDYE